MDFIILKINGRDVSQSSHEEAVEAFLTAQEPINVEVLRRPAATATVKAQSNNPTSKVSASMPASNRNSMYIPSKSPSQLSLKETSAAVQTEQRLGMVHHSSSNNDHDFEEEEDFEDLLVPGLDYEEILLCRSSGDERLGLTLCYETDAEDGLTDIFIDDIHPEGLAATDGRLRLGDQIIQINGIDVKTKAQAQEIFSSSSGDISFLVARPPMCHQYTIDEDDLDEEEAALLACENGNRHSFGTNGSGDSFLLDAANTSRSSNESGSTANSKNVAGKTRKVSSSSQDSGHLDLNTSKSSKSNSSAEIDKELYYVDKKLKDIRLDCEAITAKHNLRPNHMMMSTSLHQPLLQSEPIYETIPEVSENDEQVYSMPFDNLQHHALVSPVRSNRKAQFSETSSSPKSRSSQKQMQQQANNKLIRSTSLNKCDRNKNFENALLSQCAAAGKRVDLEVFVDEDDPQREAKLKEVEHWLKQSLEPKNQPQQQVKSNNRGSGPTLQLSSLRSSGSALSLIKPSLNKRKPVQRTVVGKMPLKGTMPRPQSLVTPTMTTDIEHLEATMKLQQEMIKRRNTPAVFQAPPPPAIPPPPIPSQTNTATIDENWEWKVKIRPDGTRYVTRRPTRNKMLKERAKRVTEERNSGLTTDDDAMSELKIGRYWSKEERKKHLEQAKERRKKQLSLIQNKNESLRKSPSASANINGYRSKSSPSPPCKALTPPPNSASSNNGGSSTALLTSEPVLLSVTTV